MDLKFFIGIILLFTNSLVGWGGIALFSHIAKVTGKRLYFAFGIGTYIFSWGMLIAGMFLVGNEGIIFFQKVANMYKWETRIIVILAVLGMVLYVCTRRPKEAKQIQTTTDKTA